MRQYAGWEASPSQKAWELLTCQCNKAIVYCSKCNGNNGLASKKQNMEKMLKRRFAHAEPYAYRLVLLKAEFTIEGENGVIRRGGTESYG